MIRGLGCDGKIMFQIEFLNSPQETSPPALGDLNTTPNDETTTECELSESFFGECLQWKALDVDEAETIQIAKAFMQQKENQAQSFIYSVISQ